MIASRLAAAAALTFIVGGQSLLAQAPWPPSVNHELAWRAADIGSGGTLVDPTHEVLFTFHNDELYQIVVTYDRGRMAGLTSDDVVDTLSETYGVPLVRNARTARNGLSADIGPGMTLVAQWEDVRWLLTLQRSTYSAQYQLVLVLKLSPLTRPAVIEA
jgi:hypothetical protein